MPFDNGTRDKLLITVLIGELITILFEIYQVWMGS